ncbi:MAG: class I SAM-dependent methyltransferase [Bacillota bacterium]
MQDCLWLGKPVKKGMAVVGSLKKIKLSPRLQSAAKFVISGEPVADIGSDHVLLPQYLIQEGFVTQIVATELKKGPAEKVKKIIDCYQLEDRVELRIGDGLKPLKPGEVSSVILAGMGAQTIIKILSESKSVLDTIKRLVLQPMTEVFLLRRWLYQNGWKIIDEDLVKEEKRFYIILVAEQGWEALPSELQLQLGTILLSKSHPLVKDYIKELIKKEQTILWKLGNAQTKKAQKMRELSEQKIKQLSGAIE